MTGVKLIASLLLLLTLSTSFAAPVTPSDDSQVLQILPTLAMPGPQREALDAAKQAVRAQPSDITAIDKLVRLYIAQTRISSDPRYLGYALALLNPWAKRTNVPLSIRLLRATIWQFNHEFRAALDELDIILRTDPKHAEAALMRANILMVQGEYEAARSNCSRLYDGGTLLIGMVCSAQVDGLSGKADKAYKEITRLLTLRNAGLGPELREWMLLSRIDLAQRLGRTDELRRDFDLLLAEGPPSTETRAVYADWLLAQQRYAELIEFARGDVRDDGLLLRIAIAETALKRPAAAAHISILRDRFAAARLRGDRVHMREEARFTLELLREPVRALKLAQDNWQVQREPADARLLLAAAIAAGQPRATEPVVHWMQRTGIEDRELRRVVSRIGAGT